MMNGTVTPSVVVVVAIAEGGGGLLGSYDWNALTFAWPAPLEPPPARPAGT